MATPVKHIEREFLLKAAMKERAGIIMNSGGGEWTVRIVEVSPKSLVFAHSLPLNLLRKGQKHEFHYNVRGQTIAFSAGITEPGEGRFRTDMPDKVFKNLSRKFTRLAPPRDLEMSFSLKGERYELDFPTSEAFIAADDLVPSPDFDPSNLKGIIAEFERKTADIATERGIVMFRERKPETVAENAIASTGRTLFIPTAISGLPQTDPFVERAIVTHDDLVDFFVAKEDLSRDFAEDEVVRFERSVRNEGVLSRIMVPVVFQEYVIGYFTVTNKQAGRPPFDLRTVETFSAFARVFAYSLKVNGYFRKAEKHDSKVGTQVIDVSAGGILFACEDAKLARSLRDDTVVSVNIHARKRAIGAAGIVKRHYEGAASGYYGIQFTGMAPEDFRFLFEYLYGKPFTDDDAASVEGIRIQKL